MGRLMRDGTAERVLRDQILRHVRGRRNINFPCLADHEQDWQRFPVDPYFVIYVMTMMLYLSSQQLPRVVLTPDAATRASQMHQGFG